MPVASNYKNYSVVSDPYFVYNRQYVNIDCGGIVKPVRFYNDEEWDAMNPQNVKDRLGFSKGYITLLICADEATYQQWLEQNAQYNKIFGWYIEGSIEIALPEGIETAVVTWEEISYENEVLETFEIEMIIARKRKHFQFKNVRYTEQDIGKKILDIVVCVGAFPIQTRYGPSTIYSFIANDNQGYEWVTKSAQNIEIGSTYQLTGAIKRIGPAKVRLTRCSIKNEFQ